MEDNYTDVSDRRDDNLYADDPSLITDVSLFVPFPPECKITATRNEHHTL
jgi:hypothetical protein